jgi:hypothetical protein
VAWPAVVAGDVCALVCVLLMDFIMAGRFCAAIHDSISAHQEITTQIMELALPVTPAPALAHGRIPLVSSRPPCEDDGQQASSAVRPRMARDARTAR